MSFTSQVKNEVGSLEIIMPECLSELSAILRNIGVIQNGVLRISTENETVAHRIFEMFRKIFSIIPKVTVRKGYNFHKNYIYLLEVNTKLDEIQETLAYLDDTPPLYLIADEREKRAYIQGLFLATGSINDPKKSRYHLEFSVNNKEYALYTLNETTNNGLIKIYASEIINNNNTIAITYK